MSHHMRSRQFLRIAAALVASALVPALAVAILSQSLRGGVFVFAIALGHALVLGLPLFAIFWARGWVNLASCTMMGFLVGALPWSVVVSVPILRGMTTWTNGMPMLVDGVPTPGGWINILWGLAFFGTFGALAGLAFGLTFRWWPGTSG